MYNYTVIHIIKNILICFIACNRSYKNATKYMFYLLYIINDEYQNLLFQNNIKKYMKIEFATKFIMDIKVKHFF